MPPNILQSLAGAAGGATPDNSQANQALVRAIVALHTYLDIERDPQKRSTATQCLSNLERLRGQHMPSPGGSSQGGGGGGPSGPPGY